MTRREEAHTIAREFHETYERLAPLYAYETREASAVAWEDVPRNNRMLMVAVVHALLERGVIAAEQVSRRGRTPTADGRMGTGPVRAQREGEVAGDG